MIKALPSAKMNVHYAFRGDVEVSESGALALNELIKDESATLVNSDSSILPFVSDSEGEKDGFYCINNSEFWRLVESGWLVPMLRGDGRLWTLSYEARSVLNIGRKVFTDIR